MLAWSYLDSTPPYLVQPCLILASLLPRLPNMTRLD